MDPYYCLWFIEFKIFLLFLIRKWNATYSLSLIFFGLLLTILLKNQKLLYPSLHFFVENYSIFTWDQLFWIIKTWIIRFKMQWWDKRSKNCCWSYGSTLSDSKGWTCFHSSSKHADWIPTAKDQVSGSKDDNPTALRAPPTVVMTPTITVTTIPIFW